MTRLHTSTIDGVRRARTDAERLEIVWAAMVRNHLIGDGDPVTTEVDRFEPGDAVVLVRDLTVDWGGVLGAGMTGVVVGVRTDGVFDQVVMVMYEVGLVTACRPEYLARHVVLPATGPGA